MIFYTIYSPKRQFSKYVSWFSGAESSRFGAEWDFTSIESSLPSYSYMGAHDGITWNVNNDDGEAPRLLSLEFFKFLIFEKNVILIAY